MQVIRDADVERDWPRIWPFWHAIVAAGTYYDWDPETDEPAARRSWMRPPPARVFVAEDGAEIVGTAVISPNRVGLGNHVANGSFMVDPAHAGRGIGRRLAEHALAEAKRDGYHGMQFNAVAETNTNAVALYRSLGFEIVGTVPDAFRHAEHGLIGLHVMYRKL